ncbi:MAG: tetratricopeptide repeat protein [Candidatus Tectimicrobiota bacterium]
MRCSLLLSWLVLFLSSAMPLGATAQALTYAQQLVVLEQANRAFEQATAAQEAEIAQQQYEQAIAGYEQLIAAGVQNAKLYYNLGNAYFRRHDLGRAITQYRRGLRLEPGNRQLQANLSYARSQRIDHFEAPQQRSLLQQLFFWQSELSLHTQWTLALLSYLLVWSGLFAHLRWQRAALRWGLLGVACACLLFTVSSALTQQQHTSARAGVIITDEVVVRKGNGESYAPQLPQPLHAGTEFAVLEERGAWLAIQLDNGTSGWIRRESAALL